MPERNVIVNTSPLLYLNMIGCLSLLEKMYGEVFTPPAVIEELKRGANQGIEVPDPSLYPWIHIQSISPHPRLPAFIDLGQGETEVLMLGMEMKN